DGRAPRALCGCRLATTEKKIPERPVEFVAECSPDNIPGNLVGRRNQCDRPRVDYVEIEVAEIVVQIFGPHQPVADCVFKPAARPRPPQPPDVSDSLPPRRRPMGHPTCVIKVFALARPEASPPVPYRRRLSVIR